jgi:hypothetical protein
LKEKKLAEKRGKGDEAFQLAEDAVTGKRSEMDDQHIADWMDENAARIAVMEHERIGLKSFSPSASGSGTGGMILGEVDSQRLFGEKGGKAIVGILESDREKKERAKDDEKVLGVPLWDETGVDRDHLMKTKTPMVLLGDTGSHPILASLKSVVERGSMSNPLFVLCLASVLLFYRYGSSILALAPKRLSCY